MLSNPARASAFTTAFPESTGRRRCDIGYAAIVRRSNFKRYKLIDVGQTPYWATNSSDEV